MLLGRFGRRLEIFFLSVTILAVGKCSILWSMLYLEGWSSRYSYFMGVFLRNRFTDFKSKLNIKFHCFQLPSIHHSPFILPCT